LASVPKPAALGSIQPNQPSPASLLITPSQKISGLIAGEDISPGDACYIKSDGKVWRSIGTAANAAAKVRGFAAINAKAAQNDAITLIRDCVWGYPTTLALGADVFLDSAVAGGLSDVATTGGTAPIGFVIDAMRVFLGKSNY
jgi:hypothetical protein